MATVNLGSIKFKWKGTYAGGTAYTIDDVVSYNGSSYICIQASTGNLPTNATYFEQMSSAGTNGTDGTDLTSTLTTQGDILYRDGSGLQRLGAGTNGQALITGGTGANPSWGDAGGGKVNQIVQDIEQGVVTISSTSYADVLSLSITPSATSSKILLAWTANGGVDNDNYGAVSLHKDGTIMSGAIGTSASGSGLNSTGSWGNTGNGAGIYIPYEANGMFLDSPNTTSAITYAMKAKRTYGSANVYLNRRGATGGTWDARSMSHLTAWEILA